MRLTVAVNANYVQKFVKWLIIDNSGYTLRRPLTKPKEIRQKFWSYRHLIPWSEAGIRAGRSNINTLIEPIEEKDRKIFLGDRVEVLIGPDKGKIGVVSRIFDESNLCIVQGLNVKLNHSETKLLLEEKPLLVTSDVALIDPAEQTKTDIEWRYSSDGERVRVSLKSGRIIPISATYNNTSYDGVDKKTYKECSKDTSDKETKKVTFVPKLSTFEDDIMQQMGIVETRQRQKKYWY